MVVVAITIAIAVSLSVSVSTLWRCVWRVIAGLPLIWRQRSIVRSTVVRLSFPIVRLMLIWRWRPLIPTVGSRVVVPVAAGTLVQPHRRHFRNAECLHVTFNLEAHDHARATQISALDHAPI